MTPDDVIRVSLVPPTNYLFSEQLLVFNAIKTLSSCIVGSVGYSIFGACPTPVALT